MRGFLGSTLHKRGFNKSDFEHCNKRFIALADQFKSSGVSFISSGGYSKPFLTHKDQVAFASMLRQALFDVLMYLEQSSSIEFNKYHDCDIFCYFILISTYYEDFELESPKFITMMQCGVFIGSYRLGSLNDRGFNLNYSGLMQPVNFHCFIAYVPTARGCLDESVEPSVIDVLTESVDAKESSAAKSLAEYIQSSCASTLDSGLGTEELKLQLHCEVLVGEKEPNKTIKVNRITGSGSLWVKCRLFSQGCLSDTDFKTLSRETKSQLERVRSDQMLS